MKILLVEDHAALAQISCSQLREIHDCEVLHVTNGARAIAAMGEFRPDLVLLDLHLPDMSGYEVATRLRDDPKWQAVVFVVLTGFGSEVDPMLAAQAGIDAHFRKPMDFDLLQGIRRRAP